MYQDEKISLMSSDCGYFNKDFTKCLKPFPLTPTFSNVVSNTVFFNE